MTSCNPSFLTCFPGPPTDQPTGDVFTGEKFDSRSLVWSERNTVTNYRLNSLYVTKITHNISILDSANEIYSANPAHGIISHSGKSIKIYFTRCSKCRLCLDLQRYSDTMSLPRLATLSNKNVN